MEKQVFAIILFLSLSLMVYNKPAMDAINLKQEKLIDAKTAVAYLVKYGYLSTNVSNAYVGNEEAVRLALMEFQQFMSIPVTGQIDKYTSEVMLKPRCGMADRINNELSKFTVNAFLTTRGKRKQLLFMNNRFDANSESGITYTWFIENRFLSTTLPKVGQFILEYGLNLWAAVTNVRFQHTRFNQGDIMLSFHKGMHGHSQGFDGKLGVLAHASLEMKAIHFDDDEDWSFNQVHASYFLRPGTDPDLVQCAAHEMGHVLGLPHVNRLTSVMFPSVLSGQRGYNYALDYEDVQQAQKLYGTCSPNKIDTIFSDFRGDGKTYIIKGTYIYKIAIYQYGDKHKPVVDKNSWPRANYHFWGGGFELFDAIFHGDDDRLYYFWYKWYHYDINNVLSPNRDQITKNSTTGIVGWPGLPEHIDAAFKHTDGRVYIFKDTLVWRWDFNAPSSPGHFPPGQVEAGFPKKVDTVFPGNPGRINAAFRWNYDGNVYFFRNRYFLIWNPKTNHADGLYKIDQWQDVCDIVQCSSENRCRSWDIRFNTCGSFCDPK